MRSVLSLFVVLACGVASAAPNEVAVAVLTGPNETRIEIVGSAQPTFTTSSATGRLIVDLHRARLAPSAARSLAGGVVRALRGEELGGGVRLTIDFEPRMEAHFSASGTTLRIEFERGLDERAAAEALSRAEEARKTQEAAALARAEEARKTQEAAALARAEEARKAEEAAALARAEEARKAVEAAALARAEEARKAEEAAALARADEARRAGEAAALARADEARRAGEAAALARAEAARKAEEAAAVARAEEARKAGEAAALARAEEARKAGEAAALARAEEARKAQEAAALATAEEAREAQEATALARKDFGAADRTRSAVGTLPAESAPDVPPVPAAIAGGSATRAPPSEPGSSGPIDLSQIGFRASPDAARVVIHHGSRVSYRIRERAGSLVLELDDCRIVRPNDRRPIDASFFGTPVGLIRPVEDRERSRVRVEIGLRRQGVPYRVHQDDDTLVLEFPP